MNLTCTGKCLVITKHLLIIYVILNFPALSYKKCFENIKTSYSTKALNKVRTKISDKVGIISYIVSNYETFSPSRYVGSRQINHPLCGCATDIIPKNSNRGTIEMFKPIVNRKVKVWHKRHIVYHTQSGIANITSCSPLSIGEKSSIINIQAV